MWHPEAKPVRAPGILLSEEILGSEVSQSLAHRLPGGSAEVGLVCNLPAPRFSFSRSGCCYHVLKLFAN